MAAIVGSLWACTVEQTGTYEAELAGSAVGSDGSGSGSGSGSGGSGSGSGSNGSGTNGSGSDGSGSNGSGSDGSGSDGTGEIGLDAGAGHHSSNGYDDKTNFYTCAHCGTADPGSGLVLLAGIAIVLRRRRR